MAGSRPLILASSSPYRRALLERLNLPFTVISPAIDESEFISAAPSDQVRRLAEAKADRVAVGAPGALVIGCDQLAVLHGVVLSKPGHHAAARAQLQLMRGQRVLFLTGLCLLDSGTGRKQTDVIEYGVIFRNYTDAEIERYLQTDAPYDCTGSFKSEQLGITLVECMEGTDPTALVGLPLIRLTQMLRECGLNLP